MIFVPAAEFMLSCVIWFVGEKFFFFFFFFSFLQKSLLVFVPAGHCEHTVGV